MDGIGIAVGNGALFGIGLFLFALWVVGVLGMSVLAFRSSIRFRMVKKPSLLVQSLAVQNNNFATGAAATELTFSMLSGLGLWDAATLKIFWHFMGIRYFAAP